MKTQKTLFAILLISLSLFLVSCKEENPNAFLCVFLEENEKQFSFCVNSKTKEEKYVEAKDMKNWITTSPDDFEILRDWYKQKCKIRP